MKTRIIVMHCLICTAFILLCFRIAYIMTDDYYLETFSNQSSYTLTVETARGFIYDKNLNPLVNQTTIYNAAVLPTQENIDTILDNSQLSYQEILPYLEKSKPFIIRFFTAISEDLNINIFKSYERYSQNQIAPHIIGYTDYSQKNGVVGIEKAYNEFLNKDVLTSKITYEVDGVGRAFEDNVPLVEEAKESKSGVVLTLDKTIQSICEKIGNEQIEKGAIVVMEVDTGNLLAVCSFPEFEPLNLSEYVNDNENAPMINRAFTAMSVGSTFKILIAAQALSSADFVDEPYFCEGFIEVDGKKINCHNTNGHGEMTLQTALENSCNPYFVQLGLSLNATKLWTLANDIGFGKSTILADGYTISGGILPTVEKLNQSLELANFSFGQGGLLATPVQIAQLLNTVANNGKTVTPKLVLGTTDDGETIDYVENDEFSTQAISQNVTETLKEYLVSGVMNTANQNAKTDGFNSAGKTATAQTGTFKDGEELNNGWFAGFFPAENPKYTIVVLTQEARTGNADASPIYKAIAESIDYNITD